MKFLHLGDLHLGKSLGSFDLIEDQKYILEQILTLAKEKEVDALLLAGDIYDKAIPSERAVSLFDSFLNRIKEEGLRAYLVSGNHDSDVRLNFGTKLFEANEIYIAGRYQGELVKKQFQDAYGTVNLYLLPFIKASTVRLYYPKEEIVSYDDAVRVVLKNANVDPKERNLLIAHQFVTKKGEAPILGGSENLAVMQVGTMEQIFSSSFDAFDYVALGHIHHPQRIGREEIRYSGSPLKYSLSEVRHEKTVPLVTMGKKGEVEIELCPLRPIRDVISLKGKMEDLLNSAPKEGSEDYVYVTLTDETIIPNAMTILQQVYPRTLKITYENSHTKKVESTEPLEVKIDEKTFPELIGDFYKQMYGSEISKEEMAIMKEIAQKAGVYHETN